MQNDLDEILRAGLAAADPEAAVRSALAEREGDLPERVHVLSAGKAAGLMARAALGALGDRLAGGLVVAKHGTDVPKEVRDSGLKLRSAAHPEPDESGVEAAGRAAELAESLGEGDLLLVLFSGGASALLADPAPPVELDDLAVLTGDLLRSGASIDEINTVRKHVSTLKGGGLAQATSPARTLSLILSDVVGDDVAHIASGPTAPDPGTLADAEKVLDAYRIQPPAAVAERLDSGPETPGPDDPVFDLVENVVCGGGRSACEAASRRAGELGYTPVLVSTSVIGEARGAAAFYAAMIREVRQSANPVPAPCALVSGGETTVVVREEGAGTGGPNQEFALALALALEEEPGWAALAVDTDGNDGPTDAAGGMVDGETAGRVRAQGLEPEVVLAGNGSYEALGSAGALIKTGPTGTNVNDLRVALVFAT